METQPHPEPSPENSDPKGKGVTESQLISSLNSSIEDLLQKISKVTNDYE
jgi:hypothetical protein